MTNSTITGLTAATTPLAGTELVPIVQTGSKKVSVANLTAGRAVQALSVTTTGTIKSGTTGTAGVLEIARSSDGLSASSLTMSANDLILDNAAGDIIFKRGSVERLRATATGTTTTGDAAATGNFIPSVSGKGVDFSVVAPAAGMTSKVLANYEEGAWTPNQGGGLTVVGAFSSSGKYTRIGREITVIGSVSGATSVAVNANSQISTNLPFATSVTGLGSAMNNTATVFSTVYVSTSTIFSASAIGATTTILFQCTYFI